MLSVLDDMLQLFALRVVVPNVLISLESLLHFRCFLSCWPLSDTARAQLALPQPQKWRDHKFFPGAKRPKQRAQPKPAAAEQQADSPPPEQSVAQQPPMDPQAGIASNI
jgi:hypothetical protein